MAGELTAALLTEAWACLDGPPEAVRRVRWTGLPGSGLPGSPLPIGALAGASVAAAALAGAELMAVRGGGAPPGVTVDDAAVAAAFASERIVRLDGRAPELWAPLSRYWRAADGWVRTHGNYPHHRERLLSALGMPAGPAEDDELRVPAVAAAFGTLTATDAAERVTAAGGPAVPVLSATAWREHEQGKAVAALPWLTLRRAGDTTRVALPRIGPGAGPAAGLRVLDLTRVLAGPVATRTLALLGADVLRIDSPRLPETPGLHLDTGMGKRSALLDLDLAGDLAVLDDLIETADVVVTGYRPGALDRFGLDPASLLRRRPSLIVASVYAWGRTGPWSDRRGFDSLVQAVSGIAEAVAAPDGTPGALPVQALDHATGYLMAAAVLRAVSRAELEGGGWIAELSLAQTAAVLLRDRPAAADSRPAEAQARPVDETAWSVERDTPLGRLRYVLPPVRVDGAPADWERSSGRWGGDEPAWT